MVLGLCWTFVGWFWCFSEGGFWAYFCTHFSSYRCSPDVPRLFMILVPGSGWTTMRIMTWWECCCCCCCCCCWWRWWRRWWWWYDDDDNSDDDDDGDDVDSFLLTLDLHFLLHVHYSSSLFLPSFSLSWSFYSFASSRSIFFIFCPPSCSFWCDGKTVLISHVRPDVIWS